MFFIREQTKQTTLQFVALSAIGKKAFAITADPSSKLRSFNSGKLEKENSKLFARSLLPEYKKSPSEI